MRFARVLVFPLLLAAVAIPALAQNTLNHPLDPPLPYLRDSGELANAGSVAAVVHEELVQMAGAAWLRVYFGDAVLAQGSSLRITSLADGEVQTLDAEGLEQWQNSTAYFNGDSVTVELVAGPATVGNRLVIEKLAWETSPEIPVQSCGICGPDDRVPSDEDWAARLLPAGCSTAVYNTDSCVVSAGHCVGGGMVLQYKVPPSSANCNINMPPVNDQFPVAQFNFTNGGVGNDWAVFTMGTNSLGEKPYDRYGEFRPLATSPPSTNDSLTIWGYGIDDECTRNQVQQTSSGTVSSVGSTHFRHDVDATFGNSGSSILRDGQEILGIATHCPCPNWATRIDHPAFVSAREQLCPTNPAQAADILGINVTAGTPTSGGIGELEASDDTYLVVEAVHQGVRNNAIIEVIAQSPFPTASELNVAVEVGAAPLSPIFVLFQLFNVSAGKWDNLFFGIIPTNGDATYSFPNVSNPGNYVNGSGHVTLRVVETARFVQTPDGYAARIDHVEVTLRP